MGTSSRCKIRRDFPPFSFLFLHPIEDEVAKRVQVVYRELCALARHACALLQTQLLLFEVPEHILPFCVRIETWKALARTGLRTTPARASCKRTR